MHTEKMNYTPAFLIACANIHQSEFIANSFVNSAKLICEQENHAEHLQSFHLLVSMAFELFPKIIIASDICFEKQEDTDVSLEEIKNIIVKKQTSFGHNIKTLFEFLPDLMNNLSIDSIRKIPDNSRSEWFVSEYHFKLNDVRYLLSIKDIEAVRYGAFSQNQDVMIDASGNQEIMNLLLRLQEYVRKYRLEQLSKMKQVYKL